MSPRAASATALLVAVLVAAVAVAVRELLRPFLPEWSLGEAAWWPAAGVALTVLARGPRHWWPAVLTGAALTSISGNLIDGVSALETLVATAANLTEIVLAGVALVGWRTHRPLSVSGFASQMRVLTALALGVGGAGAVATPYFVFLDGASWPHLRGFLLGHALVLTTFAPLVLQDHRSMWRQLRDRRRNLEWALQFAQSVVLAELIFVNGHVPTYGFVLFLPLLWGATQLGPLRMTITMTATFGVALGGARAAQGTSDITATPQLTALFCLLITMAGGVLMMLMAAQEQRQATDRARAGQALLQESEERFRLSFDNASVGMYIATLDPVRMLQITQANEAMCEFLGRPVEQVIGRTSSDFSSDALAAQDEARRFTRAGGDLAKWRYELRFTRGDGSVVCGLLSCSVIRPESDAPYIVALVVDITARNQAEERLRHLALHDSLTGLPNRTLLSDRIEQALTATARSGHAVGLLFCDLDGFKQVNDSAGHSAGDELLEQAALRLETVMRPGDTVARLGGDEFAILCADLADGRALEAIAARALAALRAPFELQAGTFTISASIGACLSGGEGETPEQLLHQADAAMYSAKRAGKDRFTVSGEVEQSRARRESWLRPALEIALRDGELVMFGQPIVDLDSGAICGVETLLRWQHRERGMLTPGYFLDVAENSPLMIPIGRRVLDESCRMAAGWQRQLGAAAPDVHVNVSGRQLADEGFARDVLEALGRHKLAPPRLVLELTETHMPLMADSLRADIVRLRELGIRFAIDDIGTGYSSLARLTELPVDILKIDMKFVKGLGENPSCDAVVRAVLAIGRTLGGEVVAEGVETSDQQERLRSYGCRLVQGFLLARPLPEAALTLTLQSAAAGRIPRGRTPSPRPILPARS